MDEPINERRAEIVGATANVKLYVMAALGFAALTIIGVLFAAYALPSPTNTTVVTTIIGVMSPFILSLLGGALHGVAVGLDGQRSLLLRAVGEKERAEGLLVGLTVNPKTNVSESDIKD